MNIPEQGELFQAVTTWFHVFTTMVDRDMAKVGPYAMVTYLAIKSHTNFKTGKAFPGIDVIVKKAGISKSQVLRALEVLEEHGYITREKQGRNNIYTLREKVVIQDDQGRPVAAAAWDYIPDGVKHAIADLKNVMMTGDFADAKIVNIQHMTVNIATDNATQTNLNVQQLLADMDKLPPDMQRILRDKLQKPE